MEQTFIKTNLSQPVNKPILSEQKNDLAYVSAVSNSNVALKIVCNEEKQEDYEHICRTADEAIKYFFTLYNKTIRLINEQEPKDSLKNMPIVCSYADMDFRLCPQIQKQFIRLMSDSKTVLGYCKASKKQKQIIMNRIQKNVCSSTTKQGLMVVSSMLSFYYLAITQLTKQQDSVLIFTPTYYRFMYTLRDQNRKIIEYQLKLRQTPEGEEFYIDFDDLASIFDTNHIKMVVWANPHNPAGRIWKKDQLEQLKDLIVKHQSLVFSDDIFCQTMEQSSSYTSLLNFSDIHPYLIWASAFGKSFNCSGSSFTYAIVHDEQMRKTLDHGLTKINIFPNYTSMKLLQSCYTVGDPWRLNTIRYIRRNFQIIKQEIDRRGLSLILYKMQSGFLAVLDFRLCKWAYSQTKNRLQSQNIFPTYFDACFEKRQPESISIVRINLAINRKILWEMIDRLQRAVRGVKKCT